MRIKKLARLSIFVLLAPRSEVNSMDYFHLMHRVFKDIVSHPFKPSTSSGIYNNNNSEARWGITEDETTQVIQERGYDLPPDERNVTAHSFLLQFD